MMKGVLGAAFLSALTVFWAPMPSANAATLDGATIRIDQFGGNPSNIVTTSGNVVVGPGVEYIANEFFDFLSFDLGGNTLTVIALTDTAFIPGPFTGFVITDVGGTIPNFSAFDVVSNDFGPSLLSFSPNELFLNFGGAGAFTTGDQLVASISVVPLPAGLPLLLTAIGGMVLVARRRGARASDAGSASVSAQA